MKVELIRIHRWILHLHCPGFEVKCCNWSICGTEISGKQVGEILIEVTLLSQVKSSADMEPLAAKTLLLHLAWDHQLYIDSFTTDRSTSVKAMIRWVYINETL